MIARSQPNDKYLCKYTFIHVHWHHWSGGNLFNMRGEGQGEGGYTVTFRNIVVEDPRPTLQHFKILMEGGKRIKYPMSYV